MSDDVKNTRLITVAVTDPRRVGLVFEVIGGIDDAKIEQYLNRIVLNYPLPSLWVKHLEDTGFFKCIPNSDITVFGADSRTKIFKLNSV